MSGGELHSRPGSVDAAFAAHREALILSEQLGERFEQGRAHAGLGNAEHDHGRADRARWHWYEALTTFTELGVPEAGEVRAALELSSS